LDNPLVRDERVKHLEFIQAVIARLSSGSFFMKGWGLTVTGAIYGFAANSLSWRTGIVGLLPALAFWFLDAYFLRQERMFRRLYEDERRFDGTIELFSMDTSRYQDRESLRSAAFSRTLAPFYGFMMISGIILFITFSP
jgi:hypothetical protein